MITAIVLIGADIHQIPETAQAVADIPGVTEVYSCAGDVDLIAKIRVRVLDEGQLLDGPAYEALAGAEGADA